MPETYIHLNSGYVNAEIMSKRRAAETILTADGCLYDIINEDGVWYLWHTDHPTASRFGTTLKQRIYICSDADDEDTARAEIYAKVIENQDCFRNWNDEIMTAVEYAEFTRDE